MTYYVEDRGRVDRSTYWMYFAAFVVLTMALLVGGVYEIFTGSYGMGILCILLVMPMGLYFRVIAMRRCRDIGWPAFLPWATMGLTFVCNLMSGFSAGMQAAAHAGAAGAGTAGLGTAGLGTAGASMGMGLLLSMVDLVFLIVIGCLDSQGGGFDRSSGYDFDPRDLPQAPRGYLGDLDDAPSGQPSGQPSSLPASQRAQRIPQGMGDAASSAPAGGASAVSGGYGAAPAPGIARPVQGFGRRGV